MQLEAKLTRINQAPLRNDLLLLRKAALEAQAEWLKKRVGVGAESQQVLSKMKKESHINRLQKLGDELSFIGQVLSAK